MSLRQCQREYTNREFIEWKAWKRRQWNSPNRTDWYLMQVAATTTRSYVKEPSKIQIQQFKLPFTWVTAVKSAEEKKREAEVVAAQAKASWFQRLGIGRKK